MKKFEEWKDSFDMPNCSVCFARMVNFEEYYMLDDSVMVTIFCPETNSFDGSVKCGDTDQEIKIA